MLKKRILVLMGLSGKLGRLLTKVNVDFEEGIVFKRLRPVIQGLIKKLRPCP